MFLFHKENLGLREELRETIKKFINNLIAEALGINFYNFYKIYKTFTRFHNFV